MLMDIYNLLNVVIISLYLAWFVTRFIVWRSVEAAERATGATNAARCLLEHAHYSAFDALLRELGVLDARSFSGAAGATATPTPWASASASSTAFAFATPSSSSISASGSSSIPVSSSWPPGASASWSSTLGSGSGFWDAPLNESDASGVPASTFTPTPPFLGGLGDVQSSGCLRRLLVERAQLPLRQEQQMKIYFLVACAFRLAISDVIFVFYEYYCRTNNKLTLFQDFYCALYSIYALYIVFALGVKSIINQLTAVNYFNWLAV